MLGLSRVMFVSTVNVTGREGAVAMVGYAVPHLLRCSTVLLVDGSYTGEIFANSVKGLIGAAVEVVKCSGVLYKFVVFFKRWIVERSFGWLEDYRLLWKNCDGKFPTLYKPQN